MTPPSGKHGRHPDLPRLLGGRLCLDFANSIEARLSDHPQDFLGGYSDALTWAWHVGILEESELDALPALVLDPSRKARMAARAVSLREAIYRVFASVARGDHPDDVDITTIEREYQLGLSEARLRRTANDKFMWVASSDQDGFQRLIWAVSHSAVELLTAEDLGRVKQCPGTGECGWLFYDDSRNGRRRWCSMEGCGSKVKMRHYYARRRGGSKPL
jgi:predicted RNA-binding Zn ribbon-like protein